MQKKKEKNKKYGQKSMKWVGEEKMSKTKNKFNFWKSY